MKKRIPGILKLFLELLLTGVIVLACVYGYNHVLNRNFKETFYQLSSGKVRENLRIIQLSDFHSSVYGEKNEPLIERIEALKPDLIAMTGDMVNEDDEDIEITLDLCRSLVEIAPVYYIYGNHETNLCFGSNDMSTEEIDEILGISEDMRGPQILENFDDEMKLALEDTGVRVLWNEYDTIQIGSSVIDVYGVLTADPYAFWQYAEDTFVDFRYENTEHFKLMLCHMPYIYETWQDDYWADLSLVGHTHGGMVRIPRIGGIYEYRHGLFPEILGGGYYMYGLYDVQGEPLIVSGGLTNNDLFRINNQPELVIVDINRY